MYHFHVLCAVLSKYLHFFLQVHKHPVASYTIVSTVPYVTSHHIWPHFIRTRLCHADIFITQSTLLTRASCNFLISQIHKWIQCIPTCYPKIAAKNVSVLSEPFDLRKKIFISCKQYNLHRTSCKDIAELLGMEHSLNKKSQY